MADVVGMVLGLSEELCDVVVIHLVVHDIALAPCLNKAAVAQEAKLV